MSVLTHMRYFVRGDDTIRQASAAFRSGEEARNERCVEIAVETIGGRQHRWTAFSNLDLLDLEPRSGQLQISGMLR